MSKGRLKSLQQISLVQTFKAQPMTLAGFERKLAEMYWPKYNYIYETQAKSRGENLQRHFSTEDQQKSVSKLSHHLQAFKRCYFCFLPCLSICSRQAAHNTHQKINFSVLCKQYQIFILPLFPLSPNYSTMIKCPKWFLFCT